MRKIWQYSKAGGWQVALCPDLVRNYFLNYWEKKRGKTVLKSKPSHVEIEITNKCNLSCKLCLRAYKKLDNIGCMGFDTFTKVFQQFPYILSVALNGFGEALLHNEFFEICRYIKRKRPFCSILVATNGTMLNEKVARLIVQTGVNKIHISLDAATAETYVKVRNADQFNQIILGIKQLLQARTAFRSTTPLVGIDFIVIDKNYQEISTFIELASTLGVDYISSLRVLYSPWGYVPARVDKTALIKEFVKARDRARELDVQILDRGLIDDPYLERFGHSSENAQCFFLWNNIRITYDGHIVLCCWHPLSETYSLGNILEQPFERFWNSEQYQELRRRSLEGKPPHPSLCVNCGGTLPI